ncbi:hypothetical protein IscW_ISCW002444 [Ixodes scapularis]|uniref:Uncharacterized protein n=1 Tax=Ixodes scapularis TaxID=6945 RepID=B7P9Z5_IXOSC|nr:hypothetical protein IscW_ISCW002444 [Ixodes scapularis]|eukprot:XP_002405875.1 hypothetical protein IscW_ISCW002444 [Ixodes scapularis]
MEDEDPRRALLMFISWNVTSSPGSVGTDMIYNYFTADTFYILYQFCLFYRKLVKEDKPIMIDWTTDQGSLSPTLVVTQQSTGGADKPAAPAAAIFKRRASFVEGRVGGPKNPLQARVPLGRLMAIRRDLSGPRTDGFPSSSLLTPFLVALEDTAPRDRNVLWAPE